MLKPTAFTSKQKSLFISDSSSDNEELPDIFSKRNLGENEAKSKFDTGTKIAAEPEMKKKVVKKSATKLDKKVEDVEKAKRKAAQAELKALRPEESLKQMVCLVDPKVEAMVGCGVVGQLCEGSVASYQVTDGRFSCVKWRRKVELYGTDETSSVTMTTDVQDEPYVLLVLPCVDFLGIVSNRGSVTCNAWVEELKQSFPACQVHVVCFGMTKYRRKVKNNAQKNFRQQVLQNSEKVTKNTKKKPSFELTDFEIEELLVELQLTSGFKVIFVESSDELVLLIQQTTKSVAEAPYKRMKRNNVQFINDKASVKVDATTGHGSYNAWKQMLLQFHNLSPDMADAILKQYPSLSCIMSAYDGCNTAEGETLLADLVIRRGVGTIQSTRRVGPELSKRIYKMLTSKNGSETL
ncbi:structure-specific endonuclease subunit EME1 [Ciona intestinalis]